MFLIYDLCDPFYKELLTNILRPIGEFWNFQMLTWQIFGKLDPLI
jgi:hypothetical protein